MLLMIYCLIYFSLFVGVLCSFNHLEEERKLVAALLLSYRCIVTINVLWLFLTVPQVCLQCVIVVFPDHTHLCLLYIDQIKIDVTCFFILI